MVKRQPFGALIRAAWERSGMTQEQFAEKLGVRQPRVVQIFEQDSITERLFVRCAKALGVEIRCSLVQRRAA